MERIRRPIIRRQRDRKTESRPTLAESTRLRNQRDRARFERLGATESTGGTFHRFSRSPLIATLSLCRCKCYRDGDMGRRCAAATWRVPFSSVALKVRCTRGTTMPMGRTRHPYTLSTTIERVIRDACAPDRQQRGRISSPSVCRSVPLACKLDNYARVVSRAARVISLSSADSANNGNNNESRARLRCGPLRFAFGNRCLGYRLNYKLISRDSSR